MIATLKRLPLCDQPRKPDERVVYESKAGKPRKGKGGRARIIGKDGKRYTLRTDGIRTLDDGPIERICCPQCWDWKSGVGSAYGFFDARQNRVCPDCQIENAAKAARALEDAGIPMGWGRTGKDENTIRPEYRYQVARQMGWKQVPTSEINKRFGARRIRQPNS